MGSIPAGGAKTARNADFPALCAVFVFASSSDGLVIFVYSRVEGGLLVLGDLNAYLFQNFVNVLHCPILSAYLIYRFACGRNLAGYRPAADIKTAPHRISAVLVL